MGHPAGAPASSRRRWPEGAVLVAAALWWMVVACLTGCAPGRTPELLEIHELSPTALEENAQLELTGSGFPDRRQARLTLSGVVYRPGEVPRDVHLRLEAQAESSSLVTLRITRETIRRLTGDGPHATFRGDVTLTFPGAHPASPVLHGSSRGVVLDFFGDTAQRHEAEERLRQQARRFLEFAGVEVDEPLVVTSVHPGGEAHRSGLVVGDQLVALDGLRLDTLSDLVPRADGRHSQIVVRREHGEETLPPWDRSKLRPANLADLPAGFAWVVGALMVLLLSVGGRARLWAVVEERLSARRAPANATSRTWLSRLASICRAGGLVPRLAPGLRFAPYGVFFLVFAVWSAVALRHPRIVSWLDLPLVVVVIAAKVLLSALIVGGRSRRSESWRLSRGLAHAAGALLAWIPVLLAVLGVVFEAGSLQLSDLVGEQGMFPHQWRLCASPWSLAAFLLLIASCVPESGPPRSPWGGPETAARFDASIAHLVEWCALALTCGLAAALFLGGWTMAPSGIAYELSPAVGAALFLLKTWLLLQVIAWWRGVLGGIRRSELLGAWLRRGLPLAFLCFALQVTATSAEWCSVHGEALRLATCSAVVLVGGFFLLRAARALYRPPLHGALNPWL